MSILRVILCSILPPLAVIDKGCGSIVLVVLLTIAGGAVFGLIRGVIYALIGATLGSTGAFLLGRYVARRLVERKLNAMPRFVAIERAVSARGHRRLGRLFPSAPVAAGPVQFPELRAGTDDDFRLGLRFRVARHYSRGVRLCVRRQGDGGSARSGGAGPGAEKRVLLRGAGRRPRRHYCGHNGCHTDRAAGSPGCIIRPYGCENERFVVHCNSCGPDSRAVSSDTRSGAGHATQFRDDAGEADLQGPGRSRDERHHRSRREGQFHP